MLRSAKGSRMIASELIILERLVIMKLTHRLTLPLHGQSSCGIRDDEEAPTLNKVDVICKGVASLT